MRIWKKWYRTIEREAILDAIRAGGPDMTLLQIQAATADHLDEGTVALITMYRTLPIFLEYGLVTRWQETAGRRRYFYTATKTEDDHDND